MRLSVMSRVTQNPPTIAPFAFSPRRDARFVGPSPARLLVIEAELARLAGLEHDGQLAAPPGRLVGGKADLLGGAAEQLAPRPPAGRFRRRVDVGQAEPEVVADHEIRDLVGEDLKTSA